MNCTQNLGHKQDWGAVFLLEKFEKILILVLKSCIYPYME